MEKQACNMHIKVKEEKMQKVIIIGCGGSGKSTLARELGKLLGLPVIHLDQLFWLPGWMAKDRESFAEEVRQEAEKEQWIMDGNFLHTMPMRLQYCDTAIMLDYPTRTCLWGVLCRVAGSYGKTRPDMGKGCPERFDFSFLKWIWGFRKKERSKCYAALENFHGRLIIIKNRRECREFLRDLRENK